ncbi:hypothetical protein BIWAKO_05276 [Bosea sp. BIWAKO-01]|nr:hypothetical protein BIWAKO_05276 [Bosea sp. BIWAKO-01]
MRHNVEYSKYPQHFQSAKARLCWREDVRGFRELNRPKVL